MWVMGVPLFLVGKLIGIFLWVSSVSWTQAAITFSSVFVVWLVFASMSAGVQMRVFHERMKRRVAERNMEFLSALFPLLLL